LLSVTLMFRCSVGAAPASCSADMMIVEDPGETNVRERGAVRRSWGAYTVGKGGGGEGWVVDANSETRG
jgi:hypothetical protein